MLAFLRLALLAILTQAQNPQQLLITVTDPAGDRIPDATITLTQGNTQRTLTSGQDGTAATSELALGEWTLSVKKEGFATMQRPVVIQGVPVNVTVPLENATQTLKVEVEDRLRIANDAVRLNSNAIGGTYVDVPVRELPATLTIVTQDLIQERGITTALDALELVPGMNIWPDTGWIPAVDARGFSTTSSGISISYDGIRPNSVPQSGRPLDAFLIDHIEVLKGPASLMSGEGAAGSNINYVTKEPKKGFFIDSLLSYDSYGKTRSGIGINVPLRRDLSARIDAIYASGGGYIQRTGNRNRAMNAQLLWVPRENLKIKGAGIYTDDNLRTYFGTPLLNSRVDPIVNYIQFGPTSFLDPRVRYTNYEIRDELNKSHNNHAMLDSELRLKHGWTLRNTFAAYVQRLDDREYESVQYVPATGKVTLGSYFLAKRADRLLQDQASLRKGLKFLRRDVDFTLGAGWIDNDQLRWGTPVGAPTFTLDFLNPSPVYDPGLQYAKTRDVFTTTKYAFLEGYIHATNRLILTGAARYDDIENIRFDNPTNQYTPAKYVPWTGRGGIIYKVYRDINVYVSKSKAVQPVNPLVNLATDQTLFSLQPTRSWEAGIKGSTLRGHIDATLAYFNMAKYNILTSNVVDGVRLTQQIGQQLANGVELSVAARPHRLLNIVGDYAYTNATYGDFNENLGTGIISRSGNTVQQVPESIWNLTPTIRIGRVFISSTVRYVGERWRDTANAFRLNGYTTLNSNIGVDLPGGARLTLTGRNLTNTVYMGRNTSDVTGRIAAPRNYGIQLTKVFALTGQ
jgi:iron complex outermembrane receptor protein